MAGDFLEDPSLPGGHDTVMLSMVLHDWAEPRCRTILEKCWAALPRGGRVVIAELLVDDERTGPPPAATQPHPMHSHPPQTQKPPPIHSLIPHPVHPCPPPLCVPLCSI